MKIIQQALKFFFAYVARIYSCARWRKLAFSMKFIEQFIEFLFTDFIVGFILARLFFFGGWRSTLSMQGIEQSFEFGFSNFFRAIGCGQSLSLFLIKHGFKFLLDSISRFGKFHRHGLRFATRSSRLNCSYSGFCTGKSFQSLNELRICRLRIIARTDLGKHLIDDIDDLQNDIHQIGSNLTIALTQNIENIFGAMTDFNQRVDCQKTGAAFNSMKTAKNGIEQFEIVWRLFQFDELLTQQLENFTGLDQEIRGPPRSAPANSRAARAEATRLNASGAVSRSGRLKYLGIPKCTASSSTQRSMRSRGSCETPHNDASVRSAINSSTDRPK